MNKIDLGCFSLACIAVGCSWYSVMIKSYIGLSLLVFVYTVLFLDVIACEIGERRDEK